MPGWHEATKRYQDEGRLVMVGIIEEQHPARCRLFMQWKRMDWPVLVDSLNLLGVGGIPLTFAIDEYGVIRKKGLKLGEAPTIEKEFLNQTYQAPPGPDPPKQEAVGADALVMWGGEDHLDEAIDAYRREIELNPQDGPAHFRLGVAYRKRYDSSHRQPNDFQFAVDNWQRALDIDPNQYIWRRRIQQYGPRLDKPYPFYDWVNVARKEILARGETPVQLAVEPGGAEFAHPEKNFHAASDEAKEPDARGRIHRDEKRFVNAEVDVVPPTVAPGAAVRVHLVFRPNTAIKAHWNNEAGDMVVWLHPPGGWQVSRRTLSFPNPPELVSLEPRKLEFEVKIPDHAEAGATKLPGYALYYVCEDAGGSCLYRRQDLNIPIEVTLPGQAN